MRRWLLASLLIVLILLAAAGIGFGWLRSQLDNAYYGAPSAEVFVQVPRGASSSGIADLLVSMGVLRDRIPFLLYVRFTGGSARLQAGEYRFAGPATPVEVARRLVEGDVFVHILTVPEGLTAQETITHIARLGLHQKADLERGLSHTEWVRDLDPAAVSLEGYLFPETYRLSRNVTSDEVLKHMTSRFREVFTKLTAESPPAAGWTGRRIVTLASMVEKEAGNEAERGLVASVLVNRLDRSMPLACDPTIIYALKLAGRYDGNIRKPDLAMDSPYNTYLHAGLPPGPIANPGAGALRAALAPPRTDYLYFVARNNGTHEFSRDFESHARAVNRYQRGGRR